jgi:hypothetical protein
LCYHVRTRFSIVVVRLASIKSDDVFVDRRLPLTDCQCQHDDEYFKTVFGQVLSKVGGMLIDCMESRSQRHVVVEARFLHTAWFFAMPACVREQASLLGQSPQLDSMVDGTCTIVNMARSSE